MDDVLDPAALRLVDGMEGKVRRLALEDL